MGKVNQYRNKISAFISSENGQRFFNFAYSIGAAIVILGALFNNLHIPGVNTPDYYTHLTMPTNREV